MRTLPKATAERGLSLEPSPAPSFAASSRRPAPPTTVKQALGLHGAKGGANRRRQVRHPAAARAGFGGNGLHRAGAIGQQDRVRLRITGHVVGQLAADDDRALTGSVKRVDHPVDHAHGVAVLRGGIKAIPCPGAADQQHMVRLLCRLQAGFAGVRLDDHAHKLRPLGQCVHLLEQLLGEFRRADTTRGSKQHQCLLPRLQIDREGVVFILQQGQRLAGQ